MRNLAAALIMAGAWTVIGGVFAVFGDLWMATALVTTAGALTAAALSGQQVALSSRPEAYTIAGAMGTGMVVAGVPPGTDAAVSSGLWSTFSLTLSVAWLEAGYQFNNRVIGA